MLSQDIGRAFDMLERALSLDSVYQKDLSALKTRHNLLNKENNFAGTVSYEDFTRTKNQISNGFINLVDMLAEEDIHPEKRLQFLVEHMDVTNEIGEIHLVNCDRRDQRKSFWTAFEQLSDQPFQFYFINACDTQMPQSLAELVIYEIIDNVLDNDNEVLNIQMERQVRKKEGRAEKKEVPEAETEAEGEGSYRVKIENLPLGPNAKFSIKKFKGYFNKRFAGLLEGGRPFSIEEMLKPGSDTLESKFEYIVTVFQITEWQQQLMEEYMDWILKTFSKPAEHTPTFLFFFPVILRGYIEEPAPDEHQEALKAIHRFCMKYPDSVRFVQPLPPVPIKDLDLWLLKLGERNRVHRERLISALIDTLLPIRKEHILAKQQLDMCEAEILQEEIYEVANRE